MLSFPLLYCALVLITDDFAHDLMKAATDCRTYYGGPLNPKFDPCKTIHDSLSKVGCEGQFSNSRLYTITINNEFYNTVAYIDFCNL